MTRAARLIARVGAERLARRFRVTVGTVRRWARHTPKSRHAGLRNFEEALEKPKPKPKKPAKAPTGIPITRRELRELEAQRKLAEQERARVAALIEEDRRAAEAERKAIEAEAAEAEAERLAAFRKQVRSDRAKAGWKNKKLRDARDFSLGPAASLRGKKLEDRDVLTGLIDNGSKRWESFLLAATKAGFSPGEARNAWFSPKARKGK